MPGVVEETMNQLHLSKNLYIQRNIYNFVPNKEVKKHEFVDFFPLSMHKKVSINDACPKVFLIVY